MTFTLTQILAEIEAVRYFLDDQAALWEAADAEPSYKAVALRVVRETVRPAEQRLARILRDEGVP